MSDHVIFWAKQGSGGFWGPPLSLFDQNNACVYVCRKLCTQETWEPRPEIGLSPYFRAWVRLDSCKKPLWGVFRDGFWMSENISEKYSPFSADGFVCLRWRTNEHTLSAPLKVCASESDRVRLVERTQVQLR